MQSNCWNSNDWTSGRNAKYFKLSVYDFFRLNRKGTSTCLRSNEVFAKRNRKYMMQLCVYNDKKGTYLMWSNAAKKDSERGIT
eukprot:6738302-Ditylum_brightwellii.AAC.1